MDYNLVSRYLCCYRIAKKLLLGLFYTLLIILHTNVCENCLSNHEQLVYIMYSVTLIKLYTKLSICLIFSQFIYKIFNLCNNCDDFIHKSNLCTCAAAIYFSIKCSAVSHFLVDNRKVSSRVARQRA